MRSLFYYIADVKYPVKNCVFLEGLLPSFQELKKVALVSLPRQAVNLYESNNCWIEVAFRRMISPDFVNIY